MIEEYNIAQRQVGKVLAMQSDIARNEALPYHIREIVEIFAKSVAELTVSQPVMRAEFDPLRASLADFSARLDGHADMIHSIRQSLRATEKLAKGLAGALAELRKDKEIIAMRRRHLKKLKEARALAKKLKDAPI